MAASRLQRLRALLPDLWALLRPRAGLLLGAGALMLAGRLAGLALPVSTKWVVDRVVLAREVELLLPLALVLALATAVQVATQHALSRLLSREAEVAVAEVRKRLHGHVLRVGVGYFDAEASGRLVSRILWDAQGLNVVVGAGLLDLTGSLVTASIASTLLVALNPSLAAVCAALVVLAAAAMARGLGHLGPHLRAQRTAWADLVARLGDGLSGIRIVKAFGREAQEAQTVAAAVDSVASLATRTQRLNAWLGSLSSVAVGVLGLAVAGLGAQAVLAGSMTVGDLATFGMLLAFLVAPLSKLAGVGSLVTGALVGMERARELLAVPREDEDPRRTVELPRLSGEIAFENVHFAYREGEDVLRGISFAAPAGSLTAVVGPSGAGKSTLMSLLAAFRQPTSGRVLVDGVDLSLVRLSSYRSQLGLALQETFLFDGTLRENVAFARPEAPREEVERACRAARVDEFASRLADGLETRVGERGVRLSGGQQQRVAIARALLANPRVVVLDEATSSLDSLSEVAVQQALVELLRGRTTFVIAHRLATVRRADRILVLREGRIAQEGRHDDLLRAPGWYADAHRLQAGEDIERGAVSVLTSRD